MLPSAGTDAVNSLMLLRGSTWVYCRLMLPAAGADAVLRHEATAAALAAACCLPPVLMLFRILMLPLLPVAAYSWCP